MTDINTTSLLTEHLGYAPIAIIDDIINSVNEIMYKCTQAVEDYLTERELVMVDELQNSNDGDDDVLMEGEIKEIPKDEIEMGTAKLETLLESSVDKNFDLFELYSLRNILTIPQELVDEGWFKLEHHKDLSTKDPVELDNSLKNLQKDIDTQLTLQKILSLQKTKILKINKLLKIYASSISFLQQNPNYEKIQPMKENIHFIISQLKTLFSDISRIKTLLIDDDNLIKIFKDKKTKNDDQYIENNTNKLLSNLGII